jgi:hypothetical protein
MRPTGESMRVPPREADVFSLSLPLFMTAGVVNGTAVAAARDGDEMYYLLDNALADGPPVWVHEAEVERSMIAAAAAHAP